MSATTLELTDLSKLKKSINKNAEEIEKISTEYNCKQEKSDEILRPGSDIQPRVNFEDVEKILERLYGIVIKEIKELISYDDRNYLIHEDRTVKNPLITNVWPHGYILKILNAHDSKKIDFIDAQNATLLYIRKQNFNCPNPVQNVYGKYYSLENINGVNHIVRLLEYMPGEIFHQVPKSNYLFFNSGEYIGKIDRALKDFDHDGFKTHKTLWMMESFPHIKEFLYVIEDHGRREIVEQVLDAFDSKVLVNIDKFQKQIIHGDFNEHNIIVTKPKGHTDYKISGILDFGDTNISPVIFDLAITMTYMILEAKDIAAGGLVLAGYTSIKNIEPNEKAILKECVAARLCQSLVMGAYTHSLHPTNDYVLTTQNIGWQILESLWKDNLDKVDEIWETTADNYLKQSYK